MTGTLSKLFAVLSLVGLHLSVQGAREDWPELVLDEHILGIGKVAADLSALAYSNETTIAEWLVSGEGTDANYSHPDYDWIRFYTQEPDQAIVAQKDGRCYIAFRGTNPNIEDWTQNANLGNLNIYKDNNVTSDDYCECREGFGDFLFSDVVTQGRADVGACVAQCDDLDDCLVLTGHSQGAANAHLAAVLLYSLNPMIINFGQPPSMDADCPWVNNERFYRFVNWIRVASDDLGFDLVPYAPTLISHSVHYGYNILVGPDPTAVYYAGFGDDVELDPNYSDLSVDGHTMSGTDFSYQSRIYDLYDNLPGIYTNGSAAGTVCEDSYMELCESGSCVENLCIDVGGVTETCIKGSCEKDSDCAGDLVCIWDSCATGAGEVQEGCPCGFSSDCANNDCITLDLLTTDFICDDGRFDTNETCVPESCDGDENCIGDLVCIYGACATASGEVEDGCPCRYDSQCANGDCITRDWFTLDFICADGVTKDVNGTDDGSGASHIVGVSWLAMLSWAFVELFF